MKKSYIVLIILLAGVMLSATNVLSAVKKKKEPLKIKVASEPSGAKVYMDGVLVCS